MMKAWSDDSIVKKDDEHLIEFLARIHTRFQHIHPFRDGNGRVGRLVMNLFLLKRGFPVLAFPPSLSALFNWSVNRGTHGDESHFSRLLAEVLFKSLQAYEDALGVQLLPKVEDVCQIEIASEAPWRVVSPGFENCKNRTASDYSQGYTDFEEIMLFPEEGN
jgi:hypothetical protein